MSDSDRRANTPERVLQEVGDIVGRKWHPIVVFRLLENGPMQFSELQTSINSISSKVLSETLNHLEGTQVVDRTIVKEKPLRVEYSLTPAGQSLEPVLSEMLQWGQDTTFNGRVP